MFTSFPILDADDKLVGLIIKDDIGFPQSLIARHHEAFQWSYHISRCHRR